MTPATISPWRARQALSFPTTGRLHDPQRSSRAMRRSRLPHRRPIRGRVRQPRAHKKTTATPFIAELVLRALR